MKKRYASWGCDKSYRWIWRAALQDAIYTFKGRFRKERSEHVINSCLSNAKEADRRNIEIMKDW